MAIETEAQRAVQSVLDEYVARGGETGLQVAAYHNGAQVVDAWSGVADLATGRLYDGETVTTVFSVTKGVASAAVHLLAERGQIMYDEVMANYWPEFGVNGKEMVTVAQALSHQAGIPQIPVGIGPGDLADFDRVAEAVAIQTPLWEPGTAVGYHSITHGWIVGGLVQAVDSRRIDQFVREELLAPIGMADQFFLGLPDSAVGRLAPLSMDDALRAETHPSPESYAWLAVPPAFYPLGESFDRPDVRRAVVPGAGGIGSARALARLYAATIGEVDGVRLLSAERVRAMSAMQTDGWDLVLEAADPKGIGYFLGHPDSPMSSRISAFGHPGYGGSIAFADPDYSFAFALVKNRLRGASPEGRSVTMDAARAARRALGIPEV